MKVPVSWLRDFVDFDVPIEELVRRLTLAGLEVEEVRYVGLPLPDDGKDLSGGTAAGTAVSGLAWDREKVVVGEILEVMPHPNADRLVLCRLNDGEREQTVLTGAPNLFHLKGEGELDEPLKVAYAREGASLFEGQAEGWQVMTLEPATIRGVESSSMACSEKELGISEDHEGIILLDADAEPGTPLVDYMGDAVLDIDITPNIARNANILGVARETAAILGVSLKEPSYQVRWEGPAIAGRASIEIEQPELNPRFVLGLIEGIEIGPSPYWLQRRLKLAGVRPINNIVDVTNYAMIEIGEPLHAFDYDVLVERAGGQAPTIITRTATPGERLTTLDDVERKLEPYMVLVTDTAGPLSIAGVMGGAESEVHAGTKNVLLEGAAWQYINIRRTTAVLRLNSEASYRFSRGVHPAMAERGVRRGLQLMEELTGGTVAEGLVDAYPLPPGAATVRFHMDEVVRWLGIDLGTGDVRDLLTPLGFEVEIDGDEVAVVPPDHRLDIGEGVTGMADVMEEIARIYGYDRIPVRLLEEEIPLQPVDQDLVLEEAVRDLLVDMGMQEIVTYRLTTPEREARARAPGAEADQHTYVRLANPSSSEREVMRHSLLASMLEIVEANARVRQRIALFEIGPVYLPAEQEQLPHEPLRLGLALHGRRGQATWIEGEPGVFGFYDLKGIVAGLLAALKVEAVDFVAEGDHASYHPGKCAAVEIDGRRVGVMGELHPLVVERYDFGEAPVVAGTFDLAAILEQIPDRISLRAVPSYPPILEDLAIVVDESIAAAEVERVMYEAGGELLAEVRLFDLYRGEQVGEGRRSLAYSLVYQSPERTLTDSEVAQLRDRIIEALEQELEAQLRT